MAFDVGSLARRALDELHLSLTAARIFEILRLTHFEMLDSRMTCTRLPMVNRVD